MSNERPNNKSMILIIIVTFILALLILVVYLATDKSPTSNDRRSEKLSVIASFYSLYYFAKEIGSDRIDVINITPIGVEPHDYEPTAKEMVRIEQSDLVILNGLNFETWGTKIKKDLENKVRFLVINEELINRNTIESVNDPHTWLDPKIAIEEVHLIKEVLSNIDPSNADFYQQNSLLLQNRLNALDLEYRNRLASCTIRDFVTAHNSFGYLASRYNLNQIAINGLSPDEEPSLQELSKISELVTTKKVKYIFFETLLSPKLSQTIAREVNAQTLVLDPVEGLSRQDIESGKNYFTQMEQNLNNLVMALQCRNT